MIQLTTFQLRRLLKEAATAGATEALQALSPKENELTKNEVMRWLKSLGKPTTFIKKLEDEGLIHGHRKGSSSNSTIRYRRSEVEQALQTLNLFPIINS